MNYFIVNKTVHMKVIVDTIFEVTSIVGYKYNN